MYNFLVIKHLPMALADYVNELTGWPCHANQSR